MSMHSEDSDQTGQCTGDIIGFVMLRLKSGL